MGIAALNPSDAYSASPRENAIPRFNRAALEPDSKKLTKNVTRHAYFVSLRAGVGGWPRPDKGVDHGMQPASIRPHTLCVPVRPLAVRWSRRGGGQKVAATAAKDFFLLCRGPRATF